MACSIALPAMVNAMKALKKKNGSKKDGETAKKAEKAKKSEEKKTEEKAPKAAKIKKGTHAEAFREQNWLLVF